MATQKELQDMSDDELNEYAGGWKRGTKKYVEAQREINRRDQSEPLIVAKQARWIALVAAVFTAIGLLISLLS